MKHTSEPFSHRSPWTGRRVVRALFRRMATAVFFVLDLVWKKDRNLVLFAQQDKYWDNSRYLFHFLVHHSEGLRRYVWLAGSNEALEQVVRENGAEQVVRMYSCQGLLLALRASTVVVTHGLTDLGLWRSVSPRKRVVHLWHAITLKRIGMLNRNLSWWRRMAYRLESRRYSLLIASSEMDRWVVAGCHAVSYDRVAVTGLPRNDALLGAPHAAPARCEDALRALLRNRKAVLYAPTWREIGDTRWFPFADMDVDRLKSGLEEDNAVMLLRPHQFDLGFREQILPLTKDTDSIVVLSVDEFPDISEALPLVDVLITDYSSIFVDYLLLDRPILFLPYDLEEYGRARGLAYDYDLITPGPKIADANHFFTELRAAIGGVDGYAEARHVVRRIFHAYPDPENCRRVARAMSDLK